MKTRSKIRIPMPARYVINLALVVGFYFLLTGLISSGVITNYWTGILITVGINTGSYTHLEDAAFSETQQLLSRAFGGNFGLLMSNFIDNAKLSKGDLEELYDMLRQAEDSL